MRRFIASATCLSLLLLLVPGAGAQQEPQPGTSAEPPAEPPPPPAEPPPPPPEGYQQQQPYPPPGYAPQPYYRPPVPYGYGYQDPERMFHRGRTLRTVGIILTGVGIGMGALGLALLADYERRLNPDRAGFDDALELIMGIGLTVTGVGCFIPGVILWPMGSNKMEQALQMGATGTSQAPALRLGATWVWRF